MPIVLSPGAATAFESLVFNGTELNDDSSYYVEDFQCPPPPKRQEWISGIDADSSQLLRRPFVDKRQVTIRLRQVQQPDRNTALAKIATIIDYIQEAELKAETGGVPLVWTPGTSSKSFTFNVLSGELTDIPISNSSEPDIGWLFNFPVITFRLDCEGPALGSWVTNAVTVTNSNPLQTVTLSNIPGDLPAQAVIRLTDAASQTRLHGEVALRSRYDDGSAFQINSSSLVTSGFAGSSTTRSGSYNTNVIRATLTTSTPVAICGVGNQSHVGTYKVRARIYPVIGTGLPDDLQVRLSYKDGDSSLQSNDYVTCPGGTAAWSDVDLGYITITEAVSGTQRWTGQIEAYSTTAGDTLDVDYIQLLPAGEGYGKARAPLTLSVPATFSARDEFDQSAGNLTGKTAAAGGTWVVLTGSDTDDFTIDTSGHTAQRTAVSDTGTIFGGTYPGRAVGLDLNLAATGAQMDWKASVDQTAVRGLLARVVDANNFLAVTVHANATGYSTIRIRKFVASVGTLLQLVFPVPTTAFTNWQRLSLVVDAGGRYGLWMGPQGGGQSLVVSGSDSALATGGALATGDVYLYDEQATGTAVTRNYDNFFAWAPAANAVVFSGRSAEIRYDVAQRADSTGTYWGPIPSYRGAHMFLPQAGSANRTCTVVAKARRNDIDAFPDDQVTDSTTLTVDYRPRYYAIPR
jgi:hypothetical protein